MDEVYENAVKFNALVHRLHSYTHSVWNGNRIVVNIFRSSKCLYLWELHPWEPHAGLNMSVEKKRKPTKQHVALFFKTFFLPALGLLVYWYVFLVADSYIIYVLMLLLLMLCHCIDTWTQRFLCSACKFAVYSVCNRYNNFNIGVENMRARYMMLEKYEFDCRVKMKDIEW